VPAFSRDYLEGQGELRPAVAEIEAVAGGKPISFRDFPGRFVFCSLADRAANVVPSTVSSIAAKKRQYAANQVRLPQDSYLVAREAESGNIPRYITGGLRAERRPRSRTQMAFLSTGYGRFYCTAYEPLRGCR
jgi:hypothetical protein